jgi:hypothetical protein
LFCFAWIEYSAKTVLCSNCQEIPSPSIFLVYKDVCFPVKHELCTEKRGHPYSYLLLWALPELKKFYSGRHRHIITVTKLGKVFSAIIHFHYKISLDKILDNNYIWFKKRPTCLCCNYFGLPNTIWRETFSTIIFI